VSFADLALATLMHLLPNAAAQFVARADSARTFSAMLTDDACKLLAALAARVTPEFPCGATRKLKAGHEYRGFIDLFAVFPDQSSLAIEIDRSNKAWSLEKLEHVATQRNCRVLWIRWRGRVKMPEGCPIPVLDLTKLGSQVPRGR
jgi:hypothetical protein